MAQAYRLLKAKCSYCHRLRAPRATVHLYVCKLRLIHHGLLLQADKLDDLQQRPKQQGKKNGKGNDDDSLSESSDESMNDTTLMQRRSAFVDRCIRAAGGAQKGTAWVRNKNEAMTQKRRNVIKDFFGILGRGQKCANCLR